jgi:hypothetical protein
VAEDQIRAMMAELNSKKNILSATFLESEDMHKRIVFNLEKKNGLCIRLLTKPLLQRVLGYLGGSEFVRKQRMQVLVSMFEMKLQCMFKYL